VVSLGALAVVAAICGAGVWSLGDGAGDASLAAAGIGDAEGDGSPWTTTTLDAGLTPSGAPSGASPAPTGDDVAGADDAGTGPVPTVTAPEPTPPVEPTATASPGATDGVAPADRQAGVATRTLVQSGSGRLLVVPGRVPAPSPAPSMTVRVEVEEGIGADGPAFAAFVMDTLNDSRSWGHGGTLTFARTDGPADFRVVLASPDLSARLCAPAETRGTMSCGGGEKAVLTMYRWMNGIPDYGSDRTSYRHYIVNHEVGHVLGHSHGYCTPGHLAPVMVQQTKGLQGCLPNAWPFPIR
jgi:Protein of unknown function (DUF3152)